MGKKPKLTITVTIVPHPNPKEGLERICKLFLDRYFDDIENAIAEHNAIKNEEVGVLDGA